MTNYGRFGEFRASPIPQHRDGRGKTGPALTAPARYAQLAPITGIAARDAADGRMVFGLAAEASAPINGFSGVLAHHEPWDYRHGQDPDTFSPSDYDACPPNTQTQRVYGTEVKVLVRNLTSDDLDFDGMRTYAGRNMFKPADLAALTNRTMVTPGAGNDTDGYWKTTADATKCWGTVLEHDKDAGWVVFQLSSLLG